MALCDSVQVVRADPAFKRLTYNFLAITSSIVVVNVCSDHHSYKASYYRSLREKRSVPLIACKFARPVVLA